MKRLNFLQRIFAAVQRRGILGLPCVAINWIMDYMSDLQFGVQTAAWIEPDDLTIDSENKHRGIAYQPTPARPLRRVLHNIKPMIPADSILVDFGCGKGRVLLIASEFGFQEV